VKRAVTTAATGALLAGGVLTGAPAAMADSANNWQYDFAVDVDTRGWKWVPQLRYSFAGQNITDAPCPGGWGQDHVPSTKLDQICRFDLTTNLQGSGSRDIVVTFLGGSTITNTGTGNSRTIDEFSIALTSETKTVMCDEDQDECSLYFLTLPSTPLPNGFDVTLGGPVTQWGVTPTWGTPVLGVSVPENLFGASLQAVNDAPVGAAADVEVIDPLGAAPDGSADDASSDDSDDLGGANLTTIRSKTLTASDHHVATHHHTRVEKMATKVHNKGGVLTIHAYGPDEDLALARASAVRAHLEAQLAKRGHTESSPIWVTYAGDPAHKKDTHVTVHWHPNTTLPGALPGVK